MNAMHDAGLDFNLDTLNKYLPMFHIAKPSYSASFRCDSISIQ